MNTFKRLLGYVLSYKVQVVFVIVLAFISGIGGIMVPYVLGVCIDKIASAGNVDFPALIKALVLLGSLYVSGAVSGLLMNGIAAKVAAKTVNRMRREGFDKLETLPVSFFDNAQMGDIISRFTNDLELVTDGVLQGGAQMLSGLIAITGSLAAMMMINIWIALSVAVIAVMAVIMAGKIAAGSSKQFRKQQEVLGQYNDLVEEYMTGFKSVKAFGLEKQVCSETGEINSRLYICGQKAQFYSSLVNPSTRLINNLSYMLVGLLGGLSAISSGMSVGSITSLLNYSVQFAKPMNETAAVMSNFQGAMAAAERFFELLDKPSQECEDNKPRLLKSYGNVEFDNVCFSYSPDRELIKDFSLTVPQGETVAVVGATGAGKTTLVNILMRFYETDSGAVLMDGADIKSLQRESVRLGFGMVLQDVWLFSGTVRENIAYGNPAATEEQVISAAKSARAHNFIMRLPKGYDTVIAGEGKSLSQGEKQLITIARAMLAGPPMMILDEATSSVDPRTEVYIQQAMSKLMEGKTSFIIAHRLSTIEKADIIVVMDRGKIAQMGSHSELLEKGGLYKKLYESQFESVSSSS